MRYSQRRANLRMNVDPGGSVAAECESRDFVGPRILAVDDDCSVRGLITEALCAAGFSVDPAPHGMAAVEAVEPGRYQVALLDLTMPGWQGLEVLERIREVDPEVLFIVASAQRDRESVIELMRCGVVDYLTKPFLLADLVGAVQRACQMYQGARDARERLLRAELLNDQLKLRGDQLTSRVREVESLNASILHHMNSGLLFVDSDGLVEVVNAQAAEILGRPLADMEGCAYQGVMPFVSRSEDPIERIRQGRCRKIRSEVEIRSSRGGCMPLAVRAAAVPGKSGAPPGVVAIFVDLTEKRKAEARMRRLDRLATIGELTAGIVHEVRNPLTGIVTSADLLGEKLETDSREGRYINLIREETVRLTRLLEELLEFSRPGVRKRRRTDIAELLERVWAMSEARAQQEDVDLQLLVEPGLPCLWVDSDKLKSVVLNLVRNALDSVRGSADAGVLLRARLTRHKSALRIDVMDNGGGLASHEVERLLKPFETTKSGGTGLGLPISLRIIEDHGGRLRLRGRPGIGAIATILLPLILARETPEVPAITTASGL